MSTKNDSIHRHLLTDSVDKKPEDYPLIDVMDSHYVAKIRSLATSLHFGDEKSLTKQEFKEECDINTILERFAETGQLPENNRTPFYDDVSEYSDYQSSLILVQEANAAFEALPATVRARFNNDPGSMIDFLSDPSNIAEARSLGLVNQPPEAPPTAADTKPPSEPKAASAAPSASTTT